MQKEQFMEKRKIQLTLDTYLCQRLNDWYWY